MHRHSLDRHWSLSPADSSNNWWIKDRPVSIVDLPHDFSIGLDRTPDSHAGASGGFFPGGDIVYEKRLTIPEQSRHGTFILEFEGVSMNAVVHVNRQFVCRHPYAYTGFTCDVTPFLADGTESAVRVDVSNAALPNSRWYSGTGIFRPVWLHTGGTLRIPPWGVAVRAREMRNGSCLVSVRTEVENTRDNTAEFRLRSCLLDSSGSTIALEEHDARAPTGETAVIEQTLVAPHANLWSLHDPCLYTVKSELVSNGSIEDEAETVTGLRFLSFDSKHGFGLNGESMKLKGGCVHHDCGILGAAAYDRAEERKLELLKTAGFNAVRCAHNPPSPAFLDACDRLGMLVIEEAFDCWREGKNPYDYSLFFEEWWERDVSAMVRRDRNHPSVIMWSTGNEIPERTGISNGYEYARRLADCVRALDDTRAVTNALNGLTDDPPLNGIKEIEWASRHERDFWGERTGPFVAPLDAVGYNYLADRYAADAERYPDRVIYGSESFPRDICGNWELVERLPHVIGDFTWTAIDYLGESALGHVWSKGEKDFLGRYPWHQAHCGDFDICGFKRPQSYYRDCVWGVSAGPYLAVHRPDSLGQSAEVSPWGWPELVPSWTWPGYKRRTFRVEVYSADAEVELRLNGKSLYRKPAGKGQRYAVSFDVPYEDGSIEAIGITGGRETARACLRTAGTATRIRLSPDRAVIPASFGSLSYVTVELLDDEGTLVPNADEEITFAISGPGSLLAVGNGNPLSEEKYVGSARSTYLGMAMAVVRGNGEEGEITMTATRKSIEPMARTIISAHARGKAE